MFVNFFLSETDPCHRKHSSLAYFKDHGTRSSQSVHALHTRYNNLICR
jgi:hypothetical protein